MHNIRTSKICHTLFTSEGNFLEDLMHQALFIIDHFLKRNRSFGPFDSGNLVQPENDVFGVHSIFCTYLAKNGEFTGGQVSNSHLRNLAHFFNDLLRLGRILEKQSDIGDKGIPHLIVVHAKG